MNNSKLFHDFICFFSKKAFTKWCNIHLSQRDMKVLDLKKDFSDGILLCNLIEILTGKQLKYNSQPKKKLLKISNINMALDCVKREGIVLVNLSAEGKKMQNNFNDFIKTFKY